MYDASNDDFSEIASIDTYDRYLREYDMLKIYASD